MSKIDTLTQDNAILKLMRQRDIAYPLDVIHRLFRDEYVLMAPMPRFLSVCEQVKADLQLVHGDDRFKLSVQEQILTWTSRSDDAAPWFSIVNDPEMGKCMQITPTARVVHDVLTMGDAQDKSTSGQSMDVLFSEIITAAARIKGDNAAIIQRAEREIEERRLMIARLKATGAEPVSEKEKQAFASSVARLMVDLNRTIGVVPENLKIANRTAREIFNHSDASHGDLVAAMLDVIMREMDSPGYTALERISALAVDDDKRAEIEEAIETIATACGDLMTADMRRQTEGFLAGISQVSRQVITQQRAASDSLVNFVRSDVFESRTGEARALRALSDAMKAFAPHTRMGKRSLGKLGLNIRVDRAAPRRMFDLRLAADMPTQKTQEVRDVDEDAAPNPEVEAMARVAIRKAYRMNGEHMANKVKDHVSRMGPVSLSWILTQNPPEFGSEELSRYVQIAMERVPAVFPTGWMFTITLPTADGGMRDYTVPDPVFMSATRDPKDAVLEAEMRRPRGEIILTNGGILTPYTQKDISS